MEAKASWSYSRLDTTDIPVIGVRIRSPVETFPGKGEAPWRVDTGYDGFVLVSEELYERLGFRLSESPREMWPVGRTVTGELLELRRAWALILVPRLGLRLEGHIETFRGNRENLLGITFLKDLKVVLDGPMRVCSVV